MRIHRVYRDDREGRVLVALALGHDLGKVVAHEERGGRIYMTGGHEVYSRQLLTWAFLVDPGLRRHPDLWQAALEVLSETRRPAVPKDIGPSASWEDRVRYVLGSDRAAIQTASVVPGADAPGPVSGGRVARPVGQLGEPMPPASPPRREAQRATPGGPSDTRVSPSVLSSGGAPPETAGR